MEVVRHAVAGRPKQTSFPLAGESGDGALEECARALCVPLYRRQVGLFPSLTPRSLSISHEQGRLRSQIQNSGLNVECSRLWAQGSRGWGLSVPLYCRQQGSVLYENRCNLEYLVVKFPARNDLH